MKKKTWDKIGTYTVSIVCAVLMISIGISAIYWQNEANTLTFARQCDRIYGIDNWVIVRVGAIQFINNSYVSPMCSCEAPIGMTYELCEYTACKEKA
jgi:hypothetical protein